MTTVPVLFEIRRLGRVWRLASSDGLFFGLFQTRASALRCAVEEADRLNHAEPRS